MSRADSNTRTSGRQVRDHTGEIFGRWTVLRRAENTGKRVRWFCRCSCGTERVVPATRLVSGNSKSCGCGSIDRLTTHGYCRGRANSRIYNTYVAMIRRCYNPSYAAYYRYGGRGIEVCARWRESFEHFLIDMGEPPPEKTLDRIDNNGHYEPGNCRWATRKEQGRNQRSNRLLTHNGETLSIAEWAERTGLRHVIISQRIDRGWSVADALGTPVQPRSKRG